MENIDFATLFQGIGTMMASGWFLASARIFLVLLGLLLIYLGWKGVLEPMVMIPMGLGMVAINCGTLIMPDGTLGNLFLDPMLSGYGCTNEYDADRFSTTCIHSDIQ